MDKIFRLDYQTPFKHYELYVKAESEVEALKAGEAIFIKEKWDGGFSEFADFESRSIKISLVTYNGPLNLILEH